MKGTTMTNWLNEGSDAITALETFARDDAKNFWGTPRRHVVLVLWRRSVSFANLTL